MAGKKQERGRAAEAPVEHGSGKTARFDAKLAQLLACSAKAFAGQGYEEASIRHIARTSGFSLAGVYHYVSCKEDILFLIQYHTFGALVENLEKILEKPVSPESQLREMIESHVGYLAEHLPDLKVCTIEMESLQGEYYRQVLERRQRYFELTRRVLQRLRDAGRGARVEPNLAALYLFGMLNWIVMWFDPKRNTPSDLSRSVFDLFLGGFRKTPVRGGAEVKSGRARNGAKKKAAR